MGKLLAQMRIGKQIGLVCVASLLGLFTIFAIMLWSEAAGSRIDQALEVATDANDVNTKVQVDLERTHRHEQAFAFGGGEAARTAFLASSDAALNHIDELLKLVADRADLVTAYQRLQSDLIAYRAAFGTLVNQAAVVGMTDDQGKIGEVGDKAQSLAGALAQVEAIQPQLTFSFMRQYEKDFLRHYDDLSLIHI